MNGYPFDPENALNTIVELVAPLLPCALLGAATIRHVAKNANTYYKDDEQGDERLHNAVLCYSIADTLLIKMSRL